MSVTITVDDRKLKQLIKDTGDEVLYIVADGVNYGIHQEFGTVHMDKQPFMKPAVEAIRPGFHAAFKNKITDKQVKEVVKKAAFNILAIAIDLAPWDTGALRNSLHVVEGDTYSVTFEPTVGGK